LAHTKRPRPEVEPGAFSLQLDLLDLGHEPAAVIGHEGRDHAEDGVTKTADVQDVAAIWSLGSRVRLTSSRDNRRW